MWQLGMMPAAFLRDQINKKAALGAFSAALQSENHLLPQSPKPRQKHGLRASISAFQD